MSILMFFQFWMFAHWSMWHMFFKHLYIGLKRWISRQHWIHLNWNAKGIHTCCEIDIRNTWSVWSLLVHCLIFGVGRNSTGIFHVGRLAWVHPAFLCSHSSLKLWNLRIHLGFMFEIVCPDLFIMFLSLCKDYFLMRLAFCFFWAYFVTVVHLADQSAIPRIWNFYHTNQNWLGTKLTSSVFLYQLCSCSYSMKYFM